MRSADPAEQARVDATLKLLDAHLATAPIAQPTADLLFRTASEVLLLRNPTDHVGCLITWHGTDTCQHTILPSLVWDLVGGYGCLAYVLDLERLWRQGAGWEHTLADAGRRMEAHQQRTPLTTEEPR